MPMGNHGTNSRCSSGICLKGLKKTVTSVRIACSRTKICYQELPDDDDDALQTLRCDTNGIMRYTRQRR